MVVVAVNNDNDGVNMLFTVSKCDSNDNRKNNDEYNCKNSNKNERLKAKTPN